MPHANGSSVVAAACALGLAVLAAAACTGDGSVELETRTFELMHLEDDVAARLVDPYVYASRADAPGGLSVVDGKLTVRETRDNLEHIASVLAQYDRPKPVVRLTFQVIEANGSSTVDPRIADVEGALRRLFRFDGYTLVEEVLIHGTEGNQVFQEFVSNDEPWAIESFIRNVREDSEGGSVQLEVRFHLGSATVLGTTVRVRAGQTAVLGRTPAAVGNRNLILAVRPELNVVN